MSFSGGKDSTVLLHIARQLYPTIPAVFSNTGLEYAAIQRFVHSWDNVDIIVPKMRFDEVISTYGYPLIGKEVAEAIYYARRIRSQGVQVERERERERGARRSCITAESCWADGQPHRNIVCEGQANHSARQMGRESHWKRMEIGGGQTEVRTPWTDLLETDRRRHNLTGRHYSRDWKFGGQNNSPKTSQRAGEPNRAGVAPIGATGEGGVFSNPEEQFGEKSQFNKEKWLPLVYTPFMISHMCCRKMKKQPMHKYQHDNGYKPILATLAEESRMRKQGWIRHGCNAFESKNPMSQPMSFWTEQDVLTYLVRYAVPIASVYGEIVHVDADGIEYPPTNLMGDILPNLKCSGCQRTGCAFCAFGMHLEKKGKTRFHILAEVEPRKYEFALEGGQWVDNPRYDPTAPKYDGDWLNWNPKQIWVPSKKGLGMRYVFDTVNEIYGKNFYRYE